MHTNVWVHYWITATLVTYRIHRFQMNLFIFYDADKMDKEYEHRIMTLEKKGRGILGIHHVTAIARDPQKNFDFYAGILGLRLVKMTVNFDDITTYHLYYGDELGRPGTI